MSQYSSSTCRTCRFLFKGYYAPEKLPGYVSLLKSALAGCSQCDLVVRAINCCVPESERDNRWEKTWGCTACWGKDDKNLSFFVLEDTFNPFPCFLGTRKLPAGDTSSEDTFQTAKTWIEHCTANHSRCGSGSEQPLPNRILDLGTKKSTSDTDTVRLYLTQNEPGRYACLSYCWGNPEALIKTTQATIHGYCDQGVAIADLPTTFRDAISIVRRLGLRYLWVDSLCIIQDDRLDWEIESSRMASIYQNSYVTIAAAKSANAQAGLFSVASSEYTTHSIDYIDANTGVSTKVYARWERPHCMDWKDADHKELPLYGRGWAFQERLLAPRVLSFAKNELFMECVLKSVCECTPERDKSGSYSDFPKPEFGTLTDFTTELNPSRRGGSHNWYQLIEQYSRLALTFESDRLPAISGIARAVQGRHGWTYLAGLWSSHLPICLGWQSNQNTQTRPSHWRAPSWSWASVDGSVRFYGTFDYSQRLLDALDFNCELLGSDTTGQLRSAYIVLSGPLVAITQNYGSGRYYPGVSQFIFDYEEDKEAAEAGAPVWWMPLAGTISGYGPFTFLLFKQTEKRIEGVENLDMKSIRRYSDMGKGQIHAYAMERIGMLWTSYQDEKTVSALSAPEKRIVVVV
ncbi:heterokaryon incompatibility protein-domain-containing protein [Tricladium varicosporioides]|nr:heterokaryon incompatibility protein-domain-containing protein [Hymenoscyphus varicosporioides]